MSYLRVYVNEIVSCSLIFDTSEVTLETFCHDARRKLLDQLHATKQRDSEEDTNDIISDDEWTQ